MNHTLKNHRKNLVFHLLFWLGYLALMIFVLSGRETPERVWRIGLTHLLPQIFIVYLNTEVLIPKFFIKKRYVTYLILVLLCFSGLYLYYEYFLPNFLSEYVAFRPQHNRNFPDKSRFLSDQPGRIPRKFMREGMRLRLVFNFTQAFALFFLSTAYKTFQIALKREKEATQLKSEHLHSELKFLKSQINPHFLFNALNNIYTLSVIKSEKTPEMILKLSEMLRYIIYDCNEDKVLLTKEVNYILNYVDLHKLKDESIKNIELNLGQFEEDLQVAPMLLIPFIENSFKHSNIEDTRTGWIKIELAVENFELKFTVSNSKSSAKYTKDSLGGVGLKNVKKRLELIYPDKHDLQILEDDQEYRVELTLGL